jgi:hypothetical protein
MTTGSLVSKVDFIAATFGNGKDGHANVAQIITRVLWMVKLQSSLAAGVLLFIPLHSFLNPVLM